MKKRILIGVSLGAALAAALLFGQGQDITSTIFNTTLMADLQASALFDLKSKSFFPASYPQQPSDLVPQDNGQGKALSDWAGPPVSASHLVFGYAAVVNGVLGLYGNVYDTRQPA